MATISGEVNPYLNERNKKFFRGHSGQVHPLYEKELQNGILSITQFLSFSILKYSYYKRLKAIYNLSAEKCFNNKSNNYNFSEAEVCEEVMMDKDVILSNIKNFNKEIEVRIQDAYEKEVVFATQKQKDFNPDTYERNHRKFLLRLNFLYRYYYYFTARRLFLDSWQEQN